jgi:hypothetical protein
MTSKLYNESSSYVKLALPLPANVEQSVGLVATERGLVARTGIEA